MKKIFAFFLSFLFFLFLFSLSSLFLLPQKTLAVNAGDSCTPTVMIPSKCADNNNTIVLHCIVNPTNTTKYYWAILSNCVGVCAGGICTGTAPNPGSNPPPTTGCPVCATGWTWDYNILKCTKTVLNPSTGIASVTSVDPPSSPVCGDKSFCYPGCGCDTPCGKNVSFQPGSLPCGTAGGVCHTAIGDISTNFNGVIKNVFTAMLSLATLVAIFLIIFSAYRLLISQGNPEQVQKAREQLTAAIVGLLFTIFSFVILQLIGINLLGLPGLR